MWSLQSRCGKTDKNDDRKLGQLSGFVRSNNRRREWQLCLEEHTDTQAEKQIQQVFWWDGV